MIKAMDAWFNTNLLGATPSGFCGEGLSVFTYDPHRSFTLPRNRPFHSIVSFYVFSLMPISGSP